MTNAYLQNINEEIQANKSYYMSFDICHLQLLLRLNFNGSDYSNKLISNMKQLKIHTHKGDNPYQDLLYYSNQVTLNYMMIS